MKKYLLTLIICLIATLRLAAEDTYVADIRLDTPYEVPAFGEFGGAFTAPRSGALLIRSIDNNYPHPYTDAAYSDEIPFAHHWFSGGQGYVIYVQAGARYFLHTPMMNLNSTPSTFYLSMDEVASLTYVCNRTEGEDFLVTDGGQLSLIFNQHIGFDRAILSCGSQREAVGANILVNSVSFDLKQILYDWLTSGKCKPGDEILLTLSGLKSLIDPSIVGGEDGTLSLKFKMPSRPVQLVSTSFEYGVFKSFWQNGSSEGLFSLKFDGPLLEAADKAPVMSIGYGSIDGEESEYYTEEVRGVCNGETLTFDLTGKIRTSATMLKSGEHFDTITLHVIGVRAANGEFVFSDGQGTLGSFTYELPFNEVSYVLYNEIIPAEGNLLGHKNIELWVNNYEILALGKASFSITPAGTSTTIVKNVPSEKMQVSDEGKLGATILIPIPAEALVEGDVTLSFPDLATADGKDHSASFAATYHNAITEGIMSPAAENSWAIYELGGRKSTHGFLPIDIRVSSGRKVLAR